MRDRLGGRADTVQNKPDVLEDTPDGSFATQNAYGTQQNISESAARASLARLRQRVWCWTAEWGEVSGWARKLCADLTLAHESSQLDDWLNRCVDQLTTGLELRQELYKAAFQRLNVSLDIIQDIWRQFMDMLGIVNSGNSILQAWLELVRFYNNIDY